MKREMKQILTIAMMMAMSHLVNAQTTTATNYKATGQGNPISPCVFCADPPALE